MEIKKQIKYLIIPICWHIIFLVFVNKVNESVRVYYDLVFYLGLSIYFFAIKSISFIDLYKEWKKGKKFWIPVIITLFSSVVAFIIGHVISEMINFNDGMNVFRVTDLLSLIAFLVVTIILPPIVEETFYRKGFINFNNKIFLFFSCLIGILFYASEHSLKPLGLIIASIWAVPFVISYIKTKNIYIPMTAHFIANLIMNGSTVIIIAIKLYS